MNKCSNGRLPFWPVGPALFPNLVARINQPTLPSQPLKVGRRGTSALGKKEGGRVLANLGLKSQAVFLGRFAASDSWAALRLAIPGRFAAGDFFDAARLGWRNKRISPRSGIGIEPGASAPGLQSTPETLPAAKRRRRVKRHPHKYCSSYSTPCFSSSSRSSS